MEVGLALAHARPEEEEKSYYSHNRADDGDGKFPQWVARPVFDDGHLWPIGMNSELNGDSFRLPIPTFWNLEFYFVITHSILPLDRGVLCRRGVALRILADAPIEDVRLHHLTVPPDPKPAECLTDAPQCHAGAPEGQSQAEQKREKEGPPFHAEALPADGDGKSAHCTVGTMPADNVRGVRPAGLWTVDRCFAFRGDPPPDRCVPHTSRNHPSQPVYGRPAH